MTSLRDRRTLLVAAVAAASATVAVLLAVRYLRGPSRPYRPWEAGGDVVREIERLTSDLLAVPGEDRKARLRGLLGDDAPARDLEGLAYQLAAMKRAASWRLAAADGYGAITIKAIYEVTDDQGQTQQVALLFERRADGTLVPIGALP